MADKTPITPEILRQLLRYEPDSGFLYWKPRDLSWFVNKRAFGRWNAIFPGKRALATPHRSGYLAGEILWEGHLAHRVAVAMSTGEWPKEVDHINGVKTDNRLVNLRVVDRKGNSRNRPRQRNSTTPHMGIYWRKDVSAWEAQIGIGETRNLVLGRFDRYEDALAARLEAEARYGYHDNHGRAPRE